MADGRTHLPPAKPNRSLFSFPPDDPRHGTENGYHNLKCHCDACKRAHADYYWGGPGRESVDRYRKQSGLLKRNYRLARQAGFSVVEARRRAHWSDPLRVDGEASNG